MNKIKISDPKESGFSVLHRFQNWQIGIIKYKAGLEKANVERLEKHGMTDESFILSKGTASLFIGQELKEVKMEVGFVYNVPRDIWHTITLSEDTVVFVIENAYTETNDKIKLT